jgi:hypothetical protein
VSEYEINLYKRENERLRRELSHSLGILDIFLNKFDSSGWPHQYDNGVHRPSCLACDILKRIEDTRRQTR